MEVIIPGLGMFFCALVASMNIADRRYGRACFFLCLFIMNCIGYARADFNQDKPLYFARIKSAGHTFCEVLKTETDPQQLWNHVYYDGEKTFQQLYTLTGDPYWLDCAERARDIYLGYIEWAGGFLQVPGFKNFTTGLFLGWHWDAVFQLSTKAAYARREADGEDITDPGLSREISYAINSYVDAESSGFGPNPLHTSRVDASFVHLRRWFVDNNADWVRPFMVGLTAKSLIKSNIRRPDIRTLPALQQAAESLWVTLWDDTAGAFRYTDRIVDDPHDMDAAPDLNMLIAPLYWWLGSKTGEMIWTVRGDKILNGWIHGAFFNTGKQYHQGTFWGLEGIGYREGASPTPLPTPTPTATRTATPIPTNTPTPGITPTRTPTAIPTQVACPDCPPRCPEKVKNRANGKVMNFVGEASLCQYR